jgi:hypothetical protein
MRHFIRGGIIVRTVINNMTFDGATTDPVQQAVRDAMIAFLAATAQAQAEATKIAQQAGIAAVKGDPRKYAGRKPSYGRIFAVDITDRVINENKQLRNWEDSLDTPWSESYRKKTYSELSSGASKYSSEADFLGGWSNEWSSHYYAWKPPALDSRIAAQNGGFIFGGIVGARLGEGFIDPTVGIKRGSFQVANPGSGETWLSIDDVRQVTCLAIKPQKIPSMSVRSNTKNAVYSIRISHRAKKDVQGMLRRIFGYTHATIYPDYPGFAAFGTKGIIPN